MAGAAQKGPTAQELWDEVNQQREAGEPPPPVDPLPQDPPQDAPKAEETPPPAPPETQPPAPQADLSPTLLARLQELDRLSALVGKLPQIEAELSTAKGRVAAMQRELDVAKQAAKAVTGGPTRAQIDAASVDVQKWKALKNDFPDWAEATEQFVDAKLAALPPTPQQQPSGISPEEMQAALSQQKAELEQRFADVAKTVEEAKVEGKYENWLDIIRTPQFAQWLPQQTAEIQSLAASSRGRDAIRLLDTYTRAVSAPAPAVAAAKQDKLAAAVTTRPSGTAPTGKTVDQMSAAELWEYERKQAAKRHAQSGRTY